MPKIKHIAISTQDVDATAKFYIDVFGMKQVGKVEDREAFLAVLKKVDIKDAPRGPIAVDRWGNPVQNIYIRKVERVGGKLQNTVVATIPAVGQFHTFNPDEYLKLPLYSRDYPPCKYC